MTNARTARALREQKAADLRARAKRSQRRRRAATIGAAVLSFLVVVVGVGVVIQNLRSSSAQAAGSTPQHLTDGAILVGKPSAPVTLTLYEDFQCPVCQEFEAESGKQIAAWVADGTVKVSYRPIAILDYQSSTDYSTRAVDAAAAVVNSDPAAYERFHDLLYANQPLEGGAGLTDAKLVELAGQAGAPTGPVRKALQDKQFAGWAKKVTDEASQAGVNQTPTVIVNGTRLKDVGLDVLTRAVQAAQKAQPIPTSTDQP
jgi:protein-disulfide isomerase